MKIHQIPGDTGIYNAGMDLLGTIWDDQIRAKIISQVNFYEDEIDLVDEDEAERAEAEEAMTVWVEQLSEMVCELQLHLKRLNKK